MLKNNFCKDFRLTSLQDFSHLKSGSNRSKQKIVIGYWKKSRLNQTNTRIGISVSKKVGKAIRRNRIKRIIREFFRLSNYRYLGIDILFVVSPNINKFFQDQKSAEMNIKNSLEQIFCKI
ncbi:MAG: ribonuclease P protein component [Bacteriovoracaceae bacterium]|nr:ribonuclease P protein component [Bacteriovoracaceae bacterium]